MDSLDKLNEIKAKLGNVGPAVMAVSKQKPASAVIPLLEAGHRLFGENRVGEALEKWQDLKKKYPDINLHLIGHLQKNKINDALKIFDSIDTVDSSELANALARRDISGKTFMAEVNIGGEPQKTGFSPSEIDAFLENSPIPITGLMCVPPAGEEPSPYFALLKEIAKRHSNIKELSMGMSSDYEIAAAQGATIVRLGTILFGARDYSKNLVALTKDFKDR